MIQPLLTVEKPLLGPAPDLLSILYPLTNDEEADESPTRRFDYVSQYPSELLTLLFNLVDSNITERWHNDMLGKVLDRIEGDQPVLSQKDEMRYLREFLRQG